VIDGLAALGLEHERVRQHVEEADAKHDSSDERQDELQTAVAERDEARRESAHERGGDHDGAIEDEKGRWRHRSTGAGLGMAAKGRRVAIRREDGVRPRSEHPHAPHALTTLPGVAVP